jgi:hypothetical protein
MALCSPAKVNRRFGGTYRLHLQGRRVRRARYRPEAGGRGLYPMLEFDELCSLSGPEVVYTESRHKTEFLRQDHISHCQCSRYSDWFGVRDLVRSNTNKLRGLSPRANYTDLRLSAKLVPTFSADRGVPRSQHNESPTAVISIF